MADKPKMFGKVSAIIAGFMSILNFSKMDDIPVNAEEKRLDFTPEQINKLKAQFGDEYFPQMLEAVDGEIKAYLSNNLQMKAIQDELAAILQEQQLADEEVSNANAKNPDTGGDVSASIQRLNAALTAETKKRKELEETVQALLKDPEGDAPAAVLKLTKSLMEHSATHLYGNASAYNAFDKRPWNARMRDGGVKATNFIDDSYIPTLQGDVEHFVRENPQVINSLFGDFEELPAEWSRRSGVLDKVADGFIIAGEIVQGRKKGWQPKNKFKFDTEGGQVYRKKIDITFDGYELQQIENTWVGQTKNMDGSHPWKMSFIGFLLSELVKQQKVDDRTAQINGIYAVDFSNDERPGDNLNSQNGLRYLWWYYRDVVQKYRPFNIGKLTEANIVDKIELLISQIPEEERKNQGFEIQISAKWKTAYDNKAGEKYTLQRHTDQGKAKYDLNYPIDRPNFKFQVLTDMTQTDFIGITYSKNVEIMDYDTSEKGKFTVTHEKRDTNIFADYRLGIRFLFVGMKAKPEDPKQFEKQQLWSNEAPIFSDEIKVPVFDDKSGILKVTYNNMVIDEKFVTDITDIDGHFVPGQVIKITGNPSLPGVKNLKNNDTFELENDYPLNTPGTITLFVNDNNTLKELGRTTTAPAVIATDVVFEGDTIDAEEGTVFRFKGNATTAFDQIINGVEGRSIKIYGTDTADVDLTFATANTNYKVFSNATLGSAANYLQFTLVNGTWTETKRVI